MMARRATKVMMVQLAHKDQRGQMVLMAEMEQMALRDPKVIAARKATKAKLAHRVRRVRAALMEQMVEMARTAHWGHKDLQAKTELMELMASAFLQAAALANTLQNEMQTTSKPVG